MSLILDSPTMAHAFDVRKLNEQLDDFDEWVDQICPATTDVEKPEGENIDIDSDSGDEFASDSEDEYATEVKTGWAKKSEGDGALDAILGCRRAKESPSSPTKRSAEDSSRRSRSSHKSDSITSSKPKSYSKSPVRSLREYKVQDESSSASKTATRRQPSKAYDSLASSEHGLRPDRKAPGKRPTLSRSKSMKMYSDRSTTHSQRAARNDDLARSEHGERLSSRRPARKDDLSRSEHGDRRPARRSLRNDLLAGSEHSDNHSRSRRRGEAIDDLSRSEQCRTSISEVTRYNRSRDDHFVQPDPPVTNPTGGTCLVVQVWNHRTKIRVVELAEEEVGETSSLEVIIELIRLQGTGDLVDELAMS